jgi:hypothetical protein
MGTLVRHGGLTVDIPEGWSDRSTLLFVGPSPLAADLPTAQHVSSPAEAVSIAFVPTAGKDVDALLAEQSEPIRKAVDQAGEAEVSEVTSGLGPGRLLSQPIVLGSDHLRQLIAVFPVGEVTVVATATAGEAGFSQAKGRLLGVLESLDTATGA